MSDDLATRAAHAPSLAGKNVTVAMMTSGGLAPCLSSSIAQLVEHWVNALRANKISGLTFRFYKGGYKGLLIGDSFVLPESDWDACKSLNYLGGSPIGNSRVKVCTIRGMDHGRVSFISTGLGFSLFLLLFVLFLQMTVDQHSRLH